MSIRDSGGHLARAASRSMSGVCIALLGLLPIHVQAQGKTRAEAAPDWIRYADRDPPYYQEGSSAFAVAKKRIVRGGQRMLGREYHDAQDVARAFLVRGLAPEYDFASARFDLRTLTRFELHFGEDATYARIECDSECLAELAPRIRADYPALDSISLLSDAETRGLRYLRRLKGRRLPAQVIVTSDSMRAEPLERMRATVAALCHGTEGIFTMDDVPSEGELRIDVGAGKVLVPVEYELEVGARPIRRNLLERVSQLNAIKTVSEAVLRHAVREWLNRFSRGLPPMKVGLELRVVGDRAKSCRALLKRRMKVNTRGVRYVPSQITNPWNVSVELTSKREGKTLRLTGRLLLENENGESIERTVQQQGLAQRCEVATDLSSILAGTVRDLTGAL